MPMTMLTSMRRKSCPDGRTNAGGGYCNGDKCRGLETLTRSMRASLRASQSYGEMQVDKEGDIEIGD